ncbi:MAG: carboxyl transferase domain-containing protein [bacterium]|nr:carboxyl transferase domain-containing protein [bacterium]
MEEKIAELQRRHTEAELGGGESRVERQHKAGKLTARERIDILIDEGTFVEFDKFAVHRCTYFGMDKNKILGDGVVTGCGKIDGRLVYVFAHDFTSFGGSLSEIFSMKICKIMDMSMKAGAPIIGLYDSGGARIQEGVASLAGYGEIFLRNVLASGVVPQISAIMGPCAGGAVYSPAVTDFVFMVRDTSFMFITGPDVIKTVMAEEVTFEELGGADICSSKSGVSHFAASNDEECLINVKELLSFLPQNNMEEPPLVPTSDDPGRIDEDLNLLVPDNPQLPYDMVELIRTIVDDHNFFEVMPDFAKNIIVGFGRFNGQAVGIVANQPAHLAGVLDINSSLKGARFIRFCDAFNIPIVTFEDVPGFLPGVDQEHGGVIKHGAKLLYAYCEATVPRITFITRKSYGGAYVVMSSKAVRGDLNYAYPTAEIAVMGPDGAVEILFRREIAAAEDADAFKAEKVEEFREKFANPYLAHELGYIDEVIEAKMTRVKVIQALEMTRNKRLTNPPKKHGNIPL